MLDKWSEWRTISEPTIKCLLPHSDAELPTQPAGEEVMISASRSVSICCNQREDT
jgi:hypothetical protein